MTVSLEQLADGSVADRNFQALARVVLDTGGITAGVRFGTVTFTFTSSNVSATETVDHGLGVVPIYAGVASWLLPGVAEGIGSLRRDTLDATSFQCRGFAASYSAFTDTVTTSWVVIG